MRRIFGLLRMSMLTTKRMRKRLSMRVMRYYKVMVAITYELLDDGDDGVL